MRLTRDKSKYIINIFRFDPFMDTNFHFEKFLIPKDKVDTLLDALIYIRDYLDGTLAFRSSCRQGRCGSCAMHVNGEYVLACECRLETLKGKITVRPLAQLPVIKDLVVDMDRFWEKLESIKPYLIRKTSPVTQSAANREACEKMIDCILCGACYSACGMTGINEAFHGPAAYVKLNRFLTDERDDATDERLEMVKGENGVFRCHSMYNCQAACPKNVDPSQNILDIKKRIS